MCHGLATYDEGPLSFVTTDFLSEVAERLLPSVQAPRIADGTKGMGWQKVHKCFL
jgi:hypothetical protein